MLDQQLTEYIRISRQQGKTDDEIRNNLLNAGWQEAQISANFDLETASSNTQLKYVELPSFGKLFSKSLKIFKNRFWSLLTVFLIAFGVQTLLSIPKNPNIVIALRVLWYVFYYFTLLVSALIINFEINFIEAYRRSFKFFGPFLWLSIVGMAVIAGGTIALVLPGIFYAILFVPVIYILINDKGRGLDALRKMRYLEKNSDYFERVVQIILFFLAVGIVILFIAVGLYLVVSKLYHGDFILDTSLITASPITIFTAPWPFLLLTLLYILIYFFVFPSIISIYYFTMYQELRMARAEPGVDMTDRWARYMKLFAWLGVSGSILVALFLVYFGYSVFGNNNLSKTFTGNDVTYSAIKKYFDPLNTTAREIANKSDLQDQIDISVIQDLSSVFLKKAVAWQGDAVFYGFRRTFSVPPGLPFNDPQSGIPKNSDSYYYESHNTKDNYEAIAIIGERKEYRTDVNPLRQSTYLNRSPNLLNLKVGPGKALSIAMLSPKFQKVRNEQGALLMQAYLNEPTFSTDLSNIWIITETTGLSSGLDNSVIIAVDGTTGELMNSRILDFYRELTGSAKK